MKSLKFYLSYFFFLFLMSSCVDENENIFVGLFTDGGTSVATKYTITLNIDNVGLVNTLTYPSNNAPWFTNNAVSIYDRVRTQVFVYNSSNLLVDIETFYNSDFSTVVNYQSVGLVAGNYKIITITDIYDYTNLKTHWDAVGTENFTTAKVEIGEYVPGYFGLIGANKREITLGSNVTYQVNNSHLGAYVVLYFNNFSYSTYRYIKGTYVINPDSYQLSSNAYSRAYTWVSNFTLDFENQYSGYYHEAYMLPNIPANFTYYFADASGTQVGTTKSVNLGTITAGVHKMISINTSTFTNSISNLAPKQSQVTTQLPVNAISFKDIKMEKSVER